MAANSLMRSSSSNNFANTGNLSATQSQHNKNKANWIADNYNYDPDEDRPPTNYHLKSMVCV